MKTEIPANGSATGRVVTFSWLVVLTVLLAFDHVVLKHEVGGLDRYADQESVLATQKQMGTLESRVAALSQLHVVSPTELAAAQQPLIDRLNSIEQIAEVNTHNDVLPPLVERVQQLETQLARIRRTSVAHKPAEASVPVVERRPEEHPPFTLIGTELRGGEQFLAIAPDKARSVRDVRVIRPGDVEGLWKLEAVDATGARFTVDGVVRLLPLP